MTSAQQAAVAALHPDASRPPAEPAEDRLAALEGQVRMLTAAVATLILERHPDVGDDEAVTP